MNKDDDETKNVGGPVTPSSGGLLSHDAVEVSRATYTPQCGRGDDVKQEFRRKNVLLNGELSWGRVNWIRGFGASRWERLPHSAFVGYRCLLGLYAVGIFLWDVIGSSDGRMWLAYLTHWLILFQLVSGAGLAYCTLMSQYYYGIQSNVWKEKPVPFLYRLTWACTSITLPGGLCVTALYWTLLAGPDSRTPLNTFAHGLMCAFSFVPQSRIQSELTPTSPSVLQSTS